MAEFVPMSIAKAKEFLTSHHWGVLATRKKDGSAQMSPITPGLDSEGRVIISSRETAYKAKNLRRDPRASLCAFSESFHGGGWVQVNGTAVIVSLPEAMSSLIYLQRQVYGEHKDWSEFHHRMERERRLIIRITIESAGPLVRG
ncbi:MAG TPA: PPOX class F420-dependent oxidoreductase [Methylomirabilota bacterium]|nr:PPOX class F420-dependent oxidoreductase [Methylomirabilota bacterium]